MSNKQTISVSSGSQKGANQVVSALDTGLGSSNYNIPFFHYMTVPANTLNTNPLSYTMTLPIGRINKLWLEFPKGCSGLVGFQIFRRVEQIFPLPAGQWFRSDNAIFPFSFTHEITNEPYQVEFRAYNIDDTFSHTIWCGLEMSGLPSDLPKELSSFLETLR